MQVTSESSSFIYCVIHVTSQVIFTLYLGVENGQTPSRKHFDKNNIIMTIFSSSSFLDNPTKVATISILLTLTVLVTTIDAQWEGMGDVGVGEVRAGTTSPMPNHNGLSYSH